MGWFIAYLLIGFVVALFTFAMIQGDEEGFKEQVGNPQISNHILRNKFLYFTLLVLFSPLFIVCKFVQKLFGKIGGNKNK